MNASQPTGAPEAPADPAGGTSADAGVEESGRRVAELEAQLADCQDRLLRTLAEQENVRRRAQREREEAVRFAASSLARDLLPTVDNLRRAIESVPGEGAADEAVRRWLSGVAATERALLEALARHGIRRIDPLGEPFDPERHEAVFELADAGRPPGTVAEVLQPGYLHHDRLLRPATVGVAKGDDGPAAEAAGTGATESPRGDEAV